MKRRVLIRKLLALGAVYVREGSEHTIYLNPRTSVNLSVPRHAEVNENVARGLLRDAGREP